MARIDAVRHGWAFAVLLCFALNACDGPGTGATYRPTHAARFADAEAREAFRDNLVSQGVEFRESPDGTLEFRDPSDRRINDAAAKVFATFYSGPSVLVDDDREFETLQEMFVARRVKTTTVVLGGGHRIAWSEADAAAAREVVEDFKGRQRAATLHQVQRQVAEKAAASDK